MFVFSGFNIIAFSKPNIVYIGVNTGAEDGTADKPLIINKAVTITTEPNADSRGAISSRSAGEEQDAYMLGVDEPIESFKGKLFTIQHIENQVKFQEKHFKYEIKLL